MKPPKPNTVSSSIPSTVTKPSQQTALSASELGKTRADFRVVEFRRIIQQKGYPLIWRKALLCPCVNKETEQARADCQTCDSSGFFYIEPLEIQGIMTGLEKKKDIYRNLGEWLEGSSMVTVEPEYRLGYRDSVEMVHSLMVFNEWITKGNRRGARHKLPENHDACRYKVVNVLHMLYERAENDYVLLERGVHFDVTKNGWIRWKGSALSIPDGTTFSVNYEFHPVWIVVTHPHSVRDTIIKFKQVNFTATALPLQAAVKLDYLIAGTSNTTEVTLASG